LSPIQSGSLIASGLWRALQKKARLCFYLLQMLSTKLIKGKYFEKI